MSCKLVLLTVEYHKIFGNIIYVKSLKMKLPLWIKENIKKIKIKIKKLILIIWFNLKLQRKITIQIIKIFISFQNFHFFLWKIKEKKNKFSKICEQTYWS